MKVSDKLKVAKLVCPKCGCATEMFGYIETCLSPFCYWSENHKNKLVAKSKKDKK